MSAVVDYHSICTESRVRCPVAAIPCGQKQKTRRGSGVPRRNNFPIALNDHLPKARIPLVAFTGHHAVCPERIIQNSASPIPQHHGNGSAAARTPRRHHDFSVRLYGNSPAVVLSNKKSLFCGRSIVKRVLWVKQNPTAGCWGDNWLLGFIGVTPSY